MAALEERYDDAMYDFSTGDYAGAVEKLKAILAEEPSYFDARLSLGMAYCRLGDVAAAIAEGHRAEEMRPNDPLVHTNLSLYYVRAGDKGRAEHHGLQARIASWKGNLAPPPPKGAAEAELEVAKPALPTVKIGGPPSSAGGAGAPPSARCPPVPIAMKSAYELAMERLSKADPVRKLTAEQKQQLAELDSIYAAKLAEREIFLKGELEKAMSAGDEEACDQLRRQIASERRVIEAQREEKKEQVRQAQG